jgi:hypothetical protein
VEPRKEEEETSDSNVWVVKTFCGICTLLFTGDEGHAEFSLW